LPALTPARDIVNLIEEAAKHARKSAEGKRMMVSFRNFQRIHLVGIGGIGMSGIAEVLLTLGYSVSRLGHQAFHDYRASPESRRHRV